MSSLESKILGLLPSDKSRKNIIVDKDCIPGFTSYQIIAEIELLKKEGKIKEHARSEVTGRYIGFKLNLNRI